MSCFYFCLKRVIPPAQDLTCDSGSERSKIDYRVAPEILESREFYETLRNQVAPCELRYHLPFGTMPITFGIGQALVLP
jgi:hypothetical protein